MILLEKHPNITFELFALLISEYPFFSTFTRFQEEVLSLPLAGIEAILSSDDLQVASEDAVYDLVLKWARTQYPKLEERKEILGSRLGRYIRFPY